MSSSYGALGGQKFAKVAESRQPVLHSDSTFSSQTSDVLPGYASRFPLKLDGFVGIACILQDLDAEFFVRWLVMPAAHRSQIAWGFGGIVGMFGMKI